MSVGGQCIDCHGLWSSLVALTIGGSGTEDQGNANVGAAVSVGVASVQAMCIVSLRDKYSTPLFVINQPTV